MKPSRCPLRGCMIALLVMLSCAPFASAADDPAFDYRISMVRDGAVEGGSSIHPIDPIRCGTEHGWIEKVEQSFDADVDNRLLEPFEKTVRVRKGENVEAFRTRPPLWRYAGAGGRHTLPGLPSVPAIVAVEYTGCVVPTGTVLLSFRAVIEISSKYDPKRLVVTYQGPPRPNGKDWKVMKDLVKLYEVEADVGDATLSSIGISHTPDFSTERHKEFWISVRIQGQGASQ